MDEVTHRVQNVHMYRTQAIKPSKKSAGAIIDEARILENKGDAAAALKLIQQAADEQICPYDELLRFKLDLGHRIAAAKRLNKDAVQRVIRGAYSHLSHRPADDVPVATPGMKAAPALSFNSMHDHGTAGGVPPNSAATVGSGTPLNLATPTLPQATTPSPMEVPTEPDSEEQHAGIGVRMFAGAPAVSPLLEPISCHGTGVDLALSRSPIEVSERPSLPGSVSLDPQNAPAPGRLSGKETSVRFSDEPPRTFVINDGPVHLEGSATPERRPRSTLDAGYTPGTALEHEDVHVTLIDEPTATFPAAEACLSPDGDGDANWAAGAVVCKRLSTNAGRTPRRSTSRVVSFHKGVGDVDEAAMPVADVFCYMSDASSTCTDELPSAPRHARQSMDAGHTPKHCRTSLVHFAASEGDFVGPGVEGAGAMIEEQSSATVVGSREWAHALASTPLVAGAAACTPGEEFGDVDTTPGSGGEDSGDEVWIVPDPASGVPRCSIEEVVRRSLNAGSTPAPSRTASLSEEVLVRDCIEEGQLDNHVVATALLAPLPAEEPSGTVAEQDVRDAAARLNFNTHEAVRVGAGEGGRVRRVGFADNTADAAAGATGHQLSVGSTVTPFALQQATTLGSRPGLNMPSTHSILTRVPEQPVSARGPLAGSLFPTPATSISTHKTPSLAVGGAAGRLKAEVASTVGGGAAGTGIQRRATPATGAVHVPCEEMEFDEDEEEEGCGGEAVSSDAAHSGGLFGTPVPEQTPDRGTPATQGPVEPVDLARGLQNGLALAVPSPPDDAVMHGADTVAPLLSDDAGVAAASPGHSSISFGSPARSAWGGFATPGSEASTPSISHHGSVAGKAPVSLQPSPCMNVDPCAADCPSLPLRLQQSTPLNVLNTAAGRFMPDLPAEDTVSIDSPDAPSETATPSPAAELVVAASTPPPVPGSAGSCDTDDLLRDDCGPFDDALCDASSMVLEASQEVMRAGAQDEDSGSGGREQAGGAEQLQAAFTRLSVTEGGRAAAAPHGSGSRELKALMSDSVASQDEMGSHEVLVPVKAAPGQRSIHGTPRVLTPVRRSRRSLAATSPPPDIPQQLADTRWAYSPNPALALPHTPPAADDDADGL